VILICEAFCKIPFIVYFCKTNYTIRKCTGATDFSNIKVHFQKPKISVQGKASFQNLNLSIFTTDIPALQQQLMSSCDGVLRPAGCDHLVTQERFSAEYMHSRYSLAQPRLWHAKLGGWLAFCQCNFSNLQTARVSNFARKDHVV